MIHGCTVPFCLRLLVRRLVKETQLHPERFSAAADAAAKTSSTCLDLTESISLLEGDSNFPHRPLPPTSLTCSCHRVTLYHTISYLFSCLFQSMLQSSMQGRRQDPGGCWSWRDHDDL